MNSINIVNPKFSKLFTILCAFTLINSARAEDAHDAGTDPVNSTVSGQFTFAAVIRRAADLAKIAYHPDRPDLPDYFANLTYDKFHEIRFDPLQTLWRTEGLPFQMQFFPRGFLFKDRVTVNIIDGDQVTPLAFHSDLFSYGKNPLPEAIPADLGFAGLRLHYPLNHDTVYDEIGVFLGASYFRAVGQYLNYGISARGLALDTGLASQEEFPVFREFWVRKPERDATEITLYALLDSPSVSGAYRFVIKPGPQTVIEVRNRLFFRTGVKKLGLAPLTSMFFHGEGAERFMDDFRPEVHDSDGLLIETGQGERIWRPLANRRGLTISDFQVTNPRLFGLLQRDRDFNNYQDLTAHYENRPSAVVEPMGDWGKGIIQLVEIPSAAERYDNIVAFWVPERLTSGGQEDWEIAYRLKFISDAEATLAGGRTLSTRVGAGGTDEPDHNKRKFVIDFGGKSLANLPANTPVEAMVTTTSGGLSPPICEFNPHTHGWRLFFELTPDHDYPADLRAFLRYGNDVLSETWDFRWIRDERY